MSVARKLSKFEANQWLESWADRHDLELSPLPRSPLRPGESYCGLLRCPVSDVVPMEAMDELVPMMSQLSFSEWGPPADDQPGGPAAGGPGPHPPLSNTGDKVTTPPPTPLLGYRVDPISALYVGMDQGSFTGHGDEAREKFILMLNKYLGEGQPGLFGMNGYKESHRWECGAVLNFTYGRPDWSIVLRGVSMATVGTEKQREFVCRLWEHTSYATRLDARCDDYSKSIIDLGQVERAEDENNFCGPRISGVHKRKKRSGGTVESIGKTVEFGTRSSARTIFYDKELESEGRIKSNRMETGYFDKQARVAWEFLAHAAAAGDVEFVKALGQLAVGKVDFRLRGVHRHVARMDRLPWWQSVLDLLGSVKLRVEKAASSLGRAWNAFEKQYLGVLARMAVVSQYLHGVDFLGGLIRKLDLARSGVTLDARPLSDSDRLFDPRAALGLANIVTVADGRAAGVNFPPAWRCST